MAKRNNRPNPHRPNGWGMIQNVLNNSMDKGQLPGATVALFLIIAVSKYPDEEIPELFEKLTNVSTFNSVMGWIVAVVILIVAFLFIRRQKSMYENEIDRISAEKTKLQEQLLNKKLPSSDN